MSDWGASLTKTDLVGEIERSGKKLNRIISVTSWVGSSNRSGGAIDWGVSIWERVIR